MARRRMLDPNIWESEDYARLSVLAKLVFVGMISNSDDEGRGRANAMYLKSKIFPYDTETTAQDIDKALDEIAQQLSIFFYRYEENEYFILTNWHKWQKVDKPQPSKIPPYDADCCELIRGSVADASENDRGRLSPKRKEEKRSKEEEKRNAEACADVILYLNEKTGASFRTDSKQSVALITDKITEGYSTEQMKAVIDSKAAEWIGTALEKYLRPQTLFGDKFEGYLNGPKKKTRKTDNAHVYDIPQIEEDFFET